MFKKLVVENDIKVYKNKWKVYNSFNNRFLGYINLPNIPSEEDVKKEILNQRFNKYIMISINKIGVEVTAKEINIFKKPKYWDEILFFKKV